MRKILGTILFAMSLMGVANVVLAQSSRDLTPVTGTEANRLRTQFGGFRHSARHHRHKAIHASASHRRVARGERRHAARVARAAAGAPLAAANAPPSTAKAPPERTVSPEQSAAIFWPDAAADLADYVLFANGNDRFWSYGYDTIVAAAFAAPAGGEQRAPRATRPVG